MSGFPLFVKGLGPVGSFGAGVESLSRLLADPASAPAPRRVKAGELTIPCLAADVSPLEAFVDRRTLRRIDHYSRLAMLAAHLAVADGGRNAPLGPRTGLVIASGYGAVRSSFAFLDTIIDFGDSIASPTHFSASVHNAAAANVSMSLSIEGPNLTVSDLGLSFGAALDAAARLLAEGACDEVLLGGVDELSEIYAYAACRDEPARLARPFGEGAAFFLLTADPAGERYGRIGPVRWGRGVVAPSSRSSLGDALGHFPTLPAFELAAALLGSEGGRAIVVEREEEEWAALEVRSARR